MAAITSNISVNLIDMIPLDCVSSIKWTKEYGEKLRELRGKHSRPSIIEEMAKDNVTFTPEAIRLLEEGLAKTIQPETFIALCNALEVHPSKIVNVIRISFPQ
jgi:DNA-binding Xre family transcriptional regulator